MNSKTSEGIEDPFIVPQWGNCDVTPAVKGYRKSGHKNVNLQKSKNKRISDTVKKIKKK